MRLIRLVFLASVFTHFGPGLSAQNFIHAKPYGDSKWLNDFICAEVIYPEVSLSQSEEGKVVIRFRVSETGEVSDARIVESVTPTLDAEAMRVFSLLLWEPAKKFGNPVASEEEFEFDFNIKKYNRTCKKRGYDTIEYPSQPVDSSLLVYDIQSVEKVPCPVFERNDMNFGKFINENITYPEAAVKQSISGKVSMTFIVETHGRISNLRIDKPLGGGCSQEAIRLVKLLKWMPGIKGNAAVRTSMHLDITFRLPDDTEHQMFDNQMINN